MADRTIENCPELNMGNYDEAGVERLNDWAIRANDEIDRLHTESEMRRAALLDEMQKAVVQDGVAALVRAAQAFVLEPDSHKKKLELEAMAWGPLAAGQATAAKGEAYAALPTHSHAGRVYEEDFLVGTCPLYTADKMRAFADATCAMRASHGLAPADLSPTAGMNIPQRILHVGGRNNDAGYVEFGSIQAVEALVWQVLRDLQAPAPADSVQEDAALWRWLAEYLVGTRTDLDDEIVASETVNDLRKLVEAAIKQGEKQ